MEIEPIKTNRDYRRTLKATCGALSGESPAMGIPTAIIDQRLLGESGKRLNPCLREHDMLGRVARVEIAQELSYPMIMQGNLHSSPLIWTTNC